MNKAKIIGFTFILLFITFVVFQLQGYFEAQEVQSYTSEEVIDERDDEQKVADNLAEAIRLRKKATEHRLEVEEALNEAIETENAAIENYNQALWNVDTIAQ